MSSDSFVGTITLSPEFSSIDIKMTCSTLRVKDKLDCVMAISRQYVVVITNPHGNRRRRKMMIFRTTDDAELLELDAFGFVTAFLEQDFLLMRSEKECKAGRITN